MLWLCNQYSDRASGTGSTSTRWLNTISSTSRRSFGVTMVTEMIRYLGPGSSLLQNVKHTASYFETRHRTQENAALADDGTSLRLVPASLLVAASMRIVKWVALTFGFVTRDLFPCRRLAYHNILYVSVSRRWGGVVSELVGVLDATKEALARSRLA